MAIDSELIGSEGFNLKFKNYLRDFYIYQFKEKGIDFKSKGKNDASNVNKIIIDSTFNPDTKRLQYALEQAAGVVWSKGEFFDPSKNKTNKKRKNKRVECITVDSRKIADNPFFSLYQLCSESTVTKGTYFAFIYALVLYFQLGNNIILSNNKSLTNAQLNDLQEHLISLAEIIESDTRRHNISKWDYFPEKDKQKFALEAIKKFESDHDDIKDIYDYLVINRQKIIFKDGKFKIVSSQSDYVEKNVLYNAFIQLGVLKRFEDIEQNEAQKKLFENRMHELTRLGIVKRKKSGQRVFYMLSNVYLSELLGKDEDLSNRLEDCIRFFAQTALLGEVGTYLLNRFDHREGASIRFKHNYIKRALNDYNNIDLLYAIKNNLCTIIEYRNASQNDLEYQKILCYPIEIRESVTDGRQYLIFYHPNLRSVSAARIEFIDSIIIGKLPKGEHFENDMLRAKELINHTWGTAFGNFKEGNVKTSFKLQHIRIIVRFNEDEPFIKTRLERETRNFASINEYETDEYGHCIEVIADVVNPSEMLQWVRSYITRVVSVEINEKKYDDFTNDVIKTYKSYLEPSLQNTINESSKIDKIVFRDEVPSNFEYMDSMHSLLFNEFFGVSFTKIGELLLEIIKKSTLKKLELNNLEINYAEHFYFEKFKEEMQLDTEDKRLEQAEGFVDVLTEFDGTEVHSKFKLWDSSVIHKPQDLLPLTSIEIQWLHNIISHPFAKFFFSESEIKDISKWLGNPEIFDINTVVLRDQYINSKRMSKQTDYIISMRKIMEANRNCNIVTVKYKSQYGEISNNVCAPVYIEYSKRDNRIRIRAVCESNIVKTFNLERILDITIMDDRYEKAASEEVIKNYIKENECELVVFFNETKNIPDRILTEFSCFKKKCIKWGNERYRMTLYYDKEDKREILIRLLSYGSLINVFNDTGEVRYELIKRLENQLELTNSMERVFLTDTNKKVTIY